VYLITQLRVQYLHAPGHRVIHNSQFGGAGIRLATIHTTVSFLCRSACRLPSADRVSRRAPAVRVFRICENGLTPRVTAKPSHTSSVRLHDTLCIYITRHVRKVPEPPVSVVNSAIVRARLRFRAV